MQFPSLQRSLLRHNAKDWGKWQLSFIPPTKLPGKKLLDTEWKSDVNYSLLH
jgi:hypothetical protein